MAGSVTTHHLLTLWSPSYAAHAMDEHLRVPLDWAGRWRRGEAPDDEVSWFEDRDLVTDGQLWAERESELKGETERMAREPSDNLLGPEVWGALDPATRTTWMGAPVQRDVGKRFQMPTV